MINIPNIYSFPSSQWEYWKIEPGEHCLVPVENFPDNGEVITMEYDDEIIEYVVGENVKFSRGNSDEFYIPNFTMECFSENKWDSIKDIIDGIYKKINKLEKETADKYVNVRKFLMIREDFMTIKSKTDDMYYSWLEIGLAIYGERKFGIENVA